MSFISSPVDATQFQMYLRLTSLHYLFSEIMSFTYITVKFFCHNLHAILESPDLLIDFLKNFICIKVYSFKKIFIYFVA